MKISLPGKVGAGQMSLELKFKINAKHRNFQCGVYFRFYQTKILKLLV